MYEGMGFALLILSHCLKYFKNKGGAGSGFRANPLSSLWICHGTEQYYKTLVLGGGLNLAPSIMYAI